MKSTPMARTALAAICIAACCLASVIPSDETAAAIAWTNPMRPVDATHPDVLHGFQPPAQDWLSGHRGVDLATFPGATVYAAGAGEVTFARQIGDRGVVVIDHGAMRTTYEPVAAVVAAGDHVAVGEAIGSISIGGHCSQSCLHWGLKRGDQYLDPLSLLGWSPVVLKPEVSDSRSTRINPRGNDPVRSSNVRIRSDVRIEQLGASLGVTTYSKPRTR